MKIKILVRVGIRLIHWSFTKLMRKRFSGFKGCGGRDVRGGLQLLSFLQLVLLALGLSGCFGAAQTGSNASGVVLQSASGTGLTLSLGQSTQLQVKVLDSATQKPLPGLPIEFSVVPGDQSKIAIQGPSVVQTDGTGIAQVQVTAIQYGGVATVEATIQNSPLGSGTQRFSLILGNISSLPESLRILPLSDEVPSLATPFSVAIQALDSNGSLMSQFNGSYITEFILSPNINLRPIGCNRFVGPISSTISGSSGNRSFPLQSVWSLDSLAEGFWRTNSQSILTTDATSWSYCSLIAISGFNYLHFKSGVAVTPMKFVFVDIPPLNGAGNPPPILSAILVDQVNSLGAPIQGQASATDLTLVPESAAHHLMLRSGTADGNPICEMRRVITQRSDWTARQNGISNFGKIDSLSCIVATAGDSSSTWVPVLETKDGQKVKTVIPNWELSGAWISDVQVNSSVPSDSTQQFVGSSAVFTPAHLGYGLVDLSVTDGGVTYHSIFQGNTAANSSNPTLRLSFAESVLKTTPSFCAQSTIDASGNCLGFDWATFPVGGKLICARQVDAFGNFVANSSANWSSPGLTFSGGSPNTCVSLSKPGSRISSTLTITDTSIGKTATIGVVFY